MPQYHIASNGKPAVCKAERRACPLGGQHYETEVDALRGALDRALGSVNLLEDAEDGNGNGRPRSDTLPAWVSKDSVGDKLNKLHDSNVSAEALTFLATDSDGYVRDAVARHPNTPTHILQLFLDDRTEDGQVRWLSLAANPSLTAQQQRELYETARVRVRTTLMSRPNLAIGVARLVRGETQAIVRQELAKNRNNHNLIHYMLAKDPDENVRWFVAKNPGVSRSALVMLEKDEDERIAEIAKNKLAKMPTSAL